MMALTYYATLLASDGYGRAAGLHLDSLLMQGAQVYVVPIGDWSPLETPPDVYALLHKPRIPTQWGILHSWPPTGWGVCDTPRRLGYTMIEGTRAPDWYVDAVNRYTDALVVPCRHNVEPLRESGVRVPIHVVPHGLDAAYYWGNLREGRPITFGTLGTLTPRKGTDILLRCFPKAFPNAEDVRLQIKVRGPYQWAISDPRISVHRGEWDLVTTRQWYQSLTGYVSPTRGEGFGLTLLEAMLCGCAVIGTNWSGPAEYLDPAFSYPLPIRGLRPVLADWPEGPDFGEWAVPDEDALVELLRHVYHHAAEARAKGLQASRTIREKYPLSLPGKLLLEILQ